MKAKPKFLRLGSFLNNAKQIRLCEDKWMGNYSFQQQYPSLYNIVRRKSDTIANVFCGVRLNISFRRYLRGNNLILWNEVVLRVMYVQLNNSHDMFRWNLYIEMVNCLYTSYNWH
jgi:hypothetical protein